MTGCEIQRRGPLGLKDVDSRLTLGDEFLRSFRECLFYSIVPSCEVGGSRTAIIMEPVCVFSVHGDEPGPCRPIEELLTPSLNREHFRDVICRAVQSVDASDREQILPEIAPGVLLLEDNVKIFPGQRLARLLDRVRAGDANSIADVSGIAHFHPFPHADPSSDDLKTFEGFTREVASFGCAGLWWVLFGFGDVDRLVGAADSGLAAFHGMLEREGFTSWLRYTSV